MLEILVFSETLKQLSYEILSQISQYHVEVFSCGELDQVSVQKLKQVGATRLNLIETSLIESGLNKEKDVEFFSNVLTDFLKSKNFDYVFSNATLTTKDIFPQLSAKFNSALVTGAIDFQISDDTLTATKSIYEGECLVDVEMIGPKPQFVVFEAKAIEPIKSQHIKTDLNGECEVVPVKMKDYQSKIKIDHTIEANTKYPSLEDAQIIVSGGRGVKDSEDMQLLEKLAAQLDASVGVSLGAVESDVAARELLIGQSASCVSPSLYIACGISGAKQHMTGLKNCQKIMAINSDQNAPIMRVADYAVVGDLYKILPRLSELLSEKLEESS